MTENKSFTNLNRYDNHRYGVGGSNRTGKLNRELPMMVK